MFIKNQSSRTILVNWLVTGFLFTLILSSQLTHADGADLPSSTITTSTTYLSDLQSLVCNPASTNNSRSLCKYGLQAVDTLQNEFLNDSAKTPHMNTCYCNEGVCPADKGGATSEDDLPVPYLDIDLNFKLLGSSAIDQPFSYTDCSGWISFLLQNVLDETSGGCADEDSEGAYCEIVNLSYNKIGQYPKAFVYQKHFDDLADPSSGVTSDNWSAGKDIGEIQAGDILAWCLNEFCQETPPSKRDGHDSGHIMLVLAATQLSTTENSDILTDTFIKHVDYHDNIEYFMLAVVDSSSVEHTSDISFGIGGETLTVLDSRIKYGDMTHDDFITKQCKRNGRINTKPGAYGGLGSGVIFIAQWQENDEYGYSMHFSTSYSFKDTTTVYHSTNKRQTVNMAYATVQDN